MRNAFMALLEFEAACGHPASTEPPHCPDVQTKMLRLTFLKEEYKEVLDEIRRSPDGSMLREDEAASMARVGQELADLIWVSIGVAVRFGIDLPAVWEEVRKANMAKFAEGSYRREDGKLMKPPGWQPPDVLGVIESQDSLAKSYGRTCDGARLDDLVMRLNAMADRFFIPQIRLLLFEAATAIDDLRFHPIQLPQESSAHNGHADTRRYLSHE